MTTTVIDPTFIGNIGRYINHSCGPNMILYPVRFDTIIPHLALFALRDIESGEELCFDYGMKACLTTNKTASGAPRRKLKLSRCMCGTDVCRGMLPFDRGIF